MHESRVFRGNCPSCHNFTYAEAVPSQPVSTAAIARADGALLVERIAEHHQSRRSRNPVQRAAFRCGRTPAFPSPFLHLRGLGHITSPRPAVPCRISHFGTIFRMASIAANWKISRRAMLPIGDPASRLAYHPLRRAPRPAFYGRSFCRGYRCGVAGVKVLLLGVLFLAIGTIDASPRTQLDDLIARAKSLELDTPYVPPPGDPLVHHAAGYAKVMCSAVFLTGLSPDFAAENVGFFTAPYEMRAKLGKPVVDRANKAVHITLPERRNADGEIFRRVHYFRAAPAKKPELRPVAARHDLETEIAAAPSSIARRASSPVHLSPRSAPSKNPPIHFRSAHVTADSASAAATSTSATAPCPVQSHSESGILPSMK